MNIDIASDILALEQRIAALEATQLKSHEELKKQAETVLETWLNDFSKRITQLESDIKLLCKWNNVVVRQIAVLEAKIE